MDIPLQDGDLIPVTLTDRLDNQVYAIFDAWSGGDVVVTATALRDHPELSQELRKTLKEARRMESELKAFLRPVLKRVKRASLNSHDVVWKEMLAAAPIL